jgi:hypothetical protein
MQDVMSWLGMLRRFGQKAGPYFMLEMLLPGGTLLALLLFLCQRRKPDIGSGAQRAVSVLMRALGGVVERGILVPAPVRVASGCRSRVPSNNSETTGSR